MADLVITAASVAVGTGGTVNTGGNAGETITAGMSVYKKSADGTWRKAKCAGTLEESGNGVTTGIALHASLAGQPLAVQTDGPITIGATTAIGVAYVISSTYGGIAPIADLVSTNKFSIIGYGISTTQIQMLTRTTGLALP